MLNLEGNNLPIRIQVQVGVSNHPLPSNVHLYRQDSGVPGFAIR